MTAPLEPIGIREETGAAASVEHPTSAGRLSRVATFLVLIAVGVELALFGGFLTPAAPRVLGIPIPIGPLIGLVGNFVVGLWAVRATGGRAAIGALTIGWLVCVIPLGTTRPAGDLVITNDVKGLAFLLLGSLAWAAAAVVAVLRRGDRTPLR